MGELVDIVSEGRAEMYGAVHSQSRLLERTVSWAVNHCIDQSPTGIIDHVCPCLVGRLEWNRGYGNPLRSAFAILDIHTSCTE